MNRTFTCHETIPCTPHDLWQFIIDFNNMPMWLKDVNKIQQISPNQFEVFIQSETGGQSFVSVFQLKEVIEEKSFTISSVIAGFLIEYKYQIIDSFEQCKVTLEVVCEGKNSLWKSLAPLMSWLLRPSDKRILTNLREAIILHLAEA
ncbi:hypothetical protein [Persicobacter psychrovividus]|uniref:Polyketide cyclase n=1 Tax=Persicobacter psychrovividus TaxID=387638 RepID=A0ABM7VC10_9BACT|nr:hypothetical protein PEPS_07060 [Persicobacter psychrovividus]